MRWPFDQYILILFGTYVSRNIVLVDKLKKSLKIYKCMTIDNRFRRGNVSGRKRRSFSNFILVVMLLNPLEIWPRLFWQNYEPRSISIVTTQNRFSDFSLVLGLPIMAVRQ